MLTIHLVQPKSPSDDPPKDKKKTRMLFPAEISSKVIVAVTVSFPVFDSDGDEQTKKSVVYRFNKIAQRQTGINFDEQEDEDDDQD